MQSAAHVIALRHDKNHASVPGSIARWAYIRKRKESRARVACITLQGADYDRYDNAYIRRVDVSDTRLSADDLNRCVRALNRHGHYFAMQSEVPGSRVLPNHDDIALSGSVHAHVFSLVFSLSRWIYHEGYYVGSRTRAHGVLAQ